VLCIKFFITTFCNILNSENICKLFVLLSSKATMVMFMLNTRSFIEYSFTEWTKEYVNWYDKKGLIA